MKTTFLSSFSKGLRNYAGKFPIIIDGAINCVNSSINNNKNIVFPNEDCNCESLGYSSISSGCPNNSDIVIYTDINGKEFICYSKCLNDPFQFDGPIYDVDYDSITNKIWVTGNFTEKIKRLYIDLSDDSSFVASPTPQYTFNQIYSLRSTGGCFLGSSSKISPHIGATYARGFKYDLDGQFSNTFAITDTNWDGYSFPFVILENLDVIHHCGYTSFDSYNLSTGSRFFTQGLNVNAHGITTNFSRNKIIMTARPAIGGPKTNPVNPRSIKYLNGTTLLLESNFSSNAGTGLYGSTFAGLLDNESMPKIATNPTDSYIYTNTTNQIGWGGGDFSWNGGAAGKHTQIAKIGTDGIEASNWNTSGNAVSSSFNFLTVFTIDSSNRVYVGGPLTTLRGIPVNSQRIYRLLENGNYDGSFSYTFNDVVRGAMWCEIDNSLLVWGNFTEVSGDTTKRYITKIFL